MRTNDILIETVMAGIGVAVTTVIGYGARKTNELIKSAKKGGKR